MAFYDHRAKTLILIHLYVMEHKALSNLNVPMSGKFECTVDADLNISMQRKPQSSPNFYEGHDFHAIIGQNGSGKSTVLDAINVFDGGSDSLVIAIFYDARSICYQICLANVMPESVSVGRSDLAFDLVENAAKFFSQHDVECVHVNAMPATPTYQGGKTRHSKSARTKHLTVARAMKTLDERRDYFHRYLRYFKECLGGEYRENIRYVFSLSAPSMGRFDNALSRFGSKVDAKLLRAWMKAFRMRSWVMQFPLCEAVCRTVVRMNVPSIISGLARLTPNPDLTALQLLECYARLDSEYPGKHPEDLIDKALVACFPAHVDSGMVPASEEASTTHALVKTEIARTELARTVSRLEDFATDLYFANPDDTILDFSGVIVEDFTFVEKLTKQASGLPGNIRGNFRWGWRGASTGELARAHVFSEFFNYLMERKENTASVIFIDEADLYLHPEWQRNFVSDLLRMSRCAKVAGPLSTLQVIVSTHSPIIISDFLSSDIVSLRMDEHDGLQVEHSSGFGSSIVDIYLKGMHLASTFGEHASQMLAGLIERSQAGTLGEEDRMLVDLIANQNLKRLILNHDQDQ